MAKDVALSTEEQILELLEQSSNERLDILGREVRSIPAVDTELRDDDESSDPILMGHAAVFNTETVIGGYFREQIAPGAFKKTIKEADVRHLFNHDPNFVLARNKNGTLDLSEDKIGLAFNAKLNRKDPQAVSVAAKVERGDVTQSSFAFRVIKDEWEFPKTSEDGSRKLPLRTIREAQLFDTSTVTYPAYEQAETVLKSSALDRLLAELGEESGARLLRHLTDGDDLDPETVLSEARAAEKAPVIEEPEVQAADEAPADSEAEEDSARTDDTEETVKYTDERGWSFEGNAETLLEIMRLRTGEQTVEVIEEELEEEATDERSEAQKLADERKARFAERLDTGDES